MADKLKEETERWQMYEAAKRAWIAEHPGATPEQYEAAMKAIAERLGI